MAVVSLHDELRTLRENICISCKQKFLPRNLVSSLAAAGEELQSSAKPAHATQFGGRPVKHAFAHMPTRSVEHRMSEVHSSVPMAKRTVINKTDRLASGSNQLITTTSSRAIAPSFKSNTKSNTPRWLVARDTPNPTINVTFMRSFGHEGKVYSTCFSADGIFLAVAKGSGAQ
jgi:hypothetical protein